MTGWSITNGAGAYGTDYLLRARESTQASASLLQSIIEPSNAHPEFEVYNLFKCTHPLYVKKRIICTHHQHLTVAAKGVPQGLILVRP